jgi:hypothetical protein
MFMKRANSSPPRLSIYALPEIESITAKILLKQKREVHLSRFSASDRGEKKQVRYFMFYF